MLPMISCLTTGQKLLKLCNKINFSSFKLFIAGIYRTDGKLTYIPKAEKAEPLPLSQEQPKGSPKEDTAESPAD